MPRAHRRFQLALDRGFVDGFLQRLQQAVRSQDPRQVAALCTEDVVFDDAGVERTVTGREALIELLGSIYGLAVDVKVDMIDSYISLDGVTAAARWRAVAPFAIPSTDLHIWRQPSSMSSATI